MHQYKYIFRKIQFNGFKYVTAPAAKTGFVQDKKRTITSQFPRILHQLLAGKVQIELLVKHPECAGCIRRTSPQTGSGRNIFMKKEMNRREGRESFFQQLVGPDAKIIFLVSWQWQTGSGKIELIGRNCLDDIPERKRVKNGFKIVESIGAPTDDVEPEVYFAIWEKNHGLLLINKTREALQSNTRRAVSV